MFPVACIPKSRAVAAAFDPLADIPFALRFQTFAAKGSPFGLFKDDGATMPAAIGDSMGAWTDPLSGTGLVYTQSNASFKAPIAGGAGLIWLNFENNNKGYLGVGNVTMPYAISVLERPTGSNGARLVRNDSTNNALICLERIGLSCFMNGSISDASVTPDGDFHIGTLVAISGQDFQFFIDGVDRTTGSVSAVDWTSVSLGNGNIEMSEAPDSDLIAVMAYPPTFKTRVEAYLANLVL